MSNVDSTLSKLVFQLNKTNLGNHNVSTSFDISQIKKSLFDKNKPSTVDDENLQVAKKIDSIRKQIKKEFGSSIENTKYINYDDEQDYEKMRTTHSNSNRFVDKRFEANDSSLFLNESSLKQKLKEPVKWKRGKFLFENAKCFDIEQNGRPNRSSLHMSNINQGLLQNSLLLPALAEIYRNFHLLKRLIPFDNTFDDDSYTGAFHFHFWYYGQWIDVVVDDYLPIDSKLSLLFSHCKSFENVLWFSLLEKAYAKLCGCYEVLENLRVTEILLDLTGGTSECYNLDKISTSLNSNDLLWNILLNACIKGSSISCITELSTKQKASNQVASNLRITHLVTKISELKRPSKKLKRLLCLKDLSNGKLNDLLKDYDRSRYFNDAHDDYLKEIRYDDENDFWVLYEDFVRFFKKIDIFNYVLGSFDNEKLTQWSCEEFHGNWVRDISAGGNTNYWSNPQYTFKINEEDLTTPNVLLPISISLVQKHSKETKNRKNVCINISLYKILDVDAYDRSIRQHESISAQDLIHIKENEFDKVKYSYKSLKEITQRFELPKGAYVLIPSTFNENIEIEFYLRIFTDRQMSKKNFVQFNF